jgi:hypothetical protein
MMVTKKDVAIPVLTTFCLSVTLLTILPTRSQTSRYDPWLDTNDDGKISMDEIMPELQAFGSTGDPTKNVTVTNVVPGIPETVNY